jgi:hypothetical protein
MVSVRARRRLFGFLCHSWAEPNPLLGGVIVGDGQSHQLIEVDFVGTIKLEQSRCDVCKFEALTHRGRGHAESGGDLLNPHSFIDQATKRIKLVGGVHGGSDDILCQTRLGAACCVDHAAGHVERFWDGLFLRQLPKCGKATRAGNDVVFIAFLGHKEVVKQTMRSNRRSEVLDCLSSGLADVERRSNKFVQGNANNFES